MKAALLGFFFWSSEVRQKEPAKTNPERLRCGEINPTLRVATLHYFTTTNVFCFCFFFFGYSFCFFDFTFHSFTPAERLVLGFVLLLFHMINTFFLSLNLWRRFYLLVCLCVSLAHGTSFLFFFFYHLTSEP